MFIMLHDDMLFQIKEVSMMCGIILNTYMKIILNIIEKWFILILF